MAAAIMPHAPRGLSGRIGVPPSKSLTQRALVAAALAGGGARVVGPLDAEDPRLLARALGELGYRLTWAGDSVTMGGRDPVASAHLFMGNNGTGARFMLALAAGLPGEWLIDGGPRLQERPMAPLVRALGALGARLEPATTVTHRGEPLPQFGRLPLRVYGRELTGGDVSLDPSASSQFVSALLLLGVRMSHGLILRLEAMPPSRPYIALTIEVLEAFGGSCHVAAGGHILEVTGGGLRPASYTVEGDWSAAAFPLAGVAVAGGELEVAGLSTASRQGDAAVAALLDSVGCTVRPSPQGVVVRGPAARPLHADLRDTPDLFPALAVVVARVGGRLTGLEGLAGKESDRLAVVAAHLERLGFPLQVAGGALSCPGRGGSWRAPAGPLDPAGDHRVAMALAVAGAVVVGVTINDPGCVGKSWPSFWSDWDGVTAGGP